MPKLGFDMAEGTLVRWVKAEGESVNKGEVLAEIETDKATVEVESQFSGVVLKRLVDEKTIVPVGDPIAVIGQPGERVEPASPNSAGGAGQPRLSRRLSRRPASSQPQRPAAAAISGRRQPAPAVAVMKASQPRQREIGPVKASPLARRMARRCRPRPAARAGQRSRRPDRAQGRRSVPGEQAKRACCCPGRSMPAVAAPPRPQRPACAPGCQTGCRPAAAVRGQPARCRPTSTCRWTGCAPRSGANGRIQAAGAAFLRHPRVRHGGGDGAAQAGQRAAARRPEAFGERLHRQGSGVGLQALPQPECFLRGE